MPIHQLAGWWCAGQSALHSIAYMLFYLLNGGLRSLWMNIYPTPYSENEKHEGSGEWNRLGLINGFGALAFIAMLILAITEAPG